MKKITKTINFKKMLGIAALCFGLSSMAVAQCNAAYTYTNGASGTVNFNSSFGASGSHYDWYFGDGGHSSVAAPTHTYQYNGTYTATLVLTDSLWTCFDSTSQIITITNGLVCNITAGFTYSASSGGLITFTNTSSNLPSGALYSWSFGDGIGSGLPSPSHLYNYNSPYIVDLTVTDSSGVCRNSTSQTITVTNADTCGLNVSYTYTLASNGNVYFMNTSTGINPHNATFSWSFGNGSTTTNQNYVTNTYAYNGTYLATLHIGDSTSVCYGAVTDTIIITNAATAPACQAHFNDSLFSNGNALFTNQSSGTTVNTNYLWNFGDGGSTSTSMNPSFTYSANGVYGVTLFISDSSTGCSGSYTDSVHITNANPACIASVSFVLHKDSLNPQPGVWEISPVYSSQVTGAYWFWGDGTYTNGLYPSHTYSVAGQYSVCVSVVAACGDSSYTCQSDSLYRLASNNSTNGANSMIQVTVVNATTGIKTNTQENAQMSLYPNPSSGVFNLNINNVSSAKAQINITNILGEVVYSTQEEVTNNTLTKAIDLQSTANGAYFMKVIVGEKSYTKKIIINK